MSFGKKKRRRKTQSSGALMQKFRAGDAAQRESLVADSLDFDRFRSLMSIRGTSCAKYFFTAFALHKNAVREKITIRSDVKFFKFAAAQKNQLRQIILISSMFLQCRQN